MGLVLCDARATRTHFRLGLLSQVDKMPLGVGAIAGTSLPIDREHVKKSLAFSAITLNAMDTVADRDFEIDFVYACARTMSHLGKIASRT